VKQTTSAQQVIDRLTERWAAKHSRPPVNCTLGREPRRRRGGSCSACTTPQEFELDQEVAQLIKTGAFKGTGVCPYQVITSHLVAALAFGPETFRARGVGQYRVDPVVKIKGALKRIGTITRAIGWTREDIEAISNKDDWWQALYAVLSAEHELQIALAKFRSQIAGKTSRSPAGPTGALHIQAVARALAGAWRLLTGRLPAKNDKTFHGLLHAAVATIFGHPVKKRNWESATKTAVKHINRDTATKT